MSSGTRLARCPESKVARSLSATKNVNIEIQNCVVRLSSQVQNASKNANIQKESTRMTVYVCLGRLQASEILSNSEPSGQILDT